MFIVQCGIWIHTVMHMCICAFRHALMAMNLHTHTILPQLFYQNKLTFVLTHSLHRENTPQLTWRVLLYIYRLPRSHWSTLRQPYWKSTVALQPWVDCVSEQCCVSAGFRRHRLLLTNWLLHFSDTLSISLLVSHQQNLLELSSSLT